MAKYLRTEKIDYGVKTEYDEDGAVQYNRTEYRSRIFLNLDRVKYFVEKSDGVYACYEDESDYVLISTSFDGLAPMLFT